MGLLLGFITVFFVAQLQSFQLLLALLSGRGLVGLSTLLLLLPHDLKFASAKLQQALVGRLLGNHRCGQRINGTVSYSHLQCLGSGRHRPANLLRMFSRLIVTKLFREFFQLSERFPLRLGDELRIGGERRRGLRRDFSAFHVPSRVDDLLLQLRQFLGLLAVLALLPLLLLLLLATGWRFTLTEDLLERPYLGKEQISLGPPQLAIRSDVFGPEVVG